MENGTTTNDDDDATREEDMTIDNSQPNVDTHDDDAQHQWVHIAAI